MPDDRLETAVGIAEIQSAPNPNSDAINAHVSWT